MTMFSRRSVLRGATALAGVTAAAGTFRAQAQQSGPIKLGMLVMASGPAALVGKPVITGAELAIEMINKAGGVNGRPLELVVQDTKANPNVALQGVRELLAADIKLICGPMLTAELFGLLPALEQGGGMVTVTGPSGVQVTHDNFSKNMFRCTSQDYMEGNGLAKLCAEKAPNTTAWQNAFVDNAALREGAKIFTHLARQAYANKALSFNEDMPVSLTAADLRPNINQIASSPAKGLYDVVFGQAGVTFWQQAQAFGLQKKLDIVVNRGGEPATFRALKKNLPDNFWASHYWWADSYKHIPESAALFELYKAREKDDFPSSNIWSGATSVMTYASAIQATRSTDPAVVAQALENGLPVKTIRGALTYRKEDHQMLVPIDAIKVEGSDNDPGFRVAGFVSRKGIDVIEPAGPGKAFSL
jgi:branched-chain amino acid transport system substrate-binding protein